MSSLYRGGRAFTAAPAGSGLPNAMICYLSTVWLRSGKFIGSPTWLSSCQGSILAANPPNPFQDWFLANESHIAFLVVEQNGKSLLHGTFEHSIDC